MTFLTTRNDEHTLSANFIWYSDRLKTKLISIVQDKEKLDTAEYVQLLENYILDQSW